MNVQQALAAILTEDPDCEYATVECRVIYSNFGVGDPEIGLQYYVYTELRGAHDGRTLTEALDKWRAAGEQKDPDAPIPRKFAAFEEEAKTLTTTEGIDTVAPMTRAVIK